MGMRIGYARVSSSGQTLDVHLDRLTDCGQIFSEKASAAAAKGRPELQKALQAFVGLICSGQSDGESEP